jgi:membrane associated rhomboid family serine protease
MKTLTVVLGVIGLVSSVLAPVLAWLGTPVGPWPGWFGYLGACVCFGSLAVVDALAGRWPEKVRRKYPTADDVLGPEA